MNKVLFCMMSWLMLISCHKKTALFSLNSEQLNLKDLVYDNLAIRSKIKYEDETGYTKATANIRIKKDSIIWFSITPGLGIEAARGIITKDSAIILNKVNKSYHILSPTEMAKKFHFHFDLNIITSMLIGNLIWPIHRTDRVIKANGFYEVKKKEQAMTILNFIGKQSMKLERMEAVSDTSHNSLSIQYADFKEIQQEVMPTQVKVDVKYLSKKYHTNQTTTVQWTHARIEIDKKNMSFRFHIPPRYVQE